MFLHFFCPNLDSTSVTLTFAMVGFKQRLEHAFTLGEFQFAVRLIVYREALNQNDLIIANDAQSGTGSSQAR